MSEKQMIDAYRAADLARLEITQMRIEDGISLDQIFRKITEVSAEFLRVERVGIWMLVDDQKALRCMDLFEKSKQTHSSGVTIQVSAFPKYIAALERRKSLSADLAVTDPRASELAEAYLIPLGITSMLDASIIVAGKLVGVICQEHVGPPREWTTEESDFAGSMADLLALKLRATEVLELRSALRSHDIQLSQTRKKASIADMASRVAQDFRSILAAMLEKTQEILDNPSTSHRIIEHAKEIHEAGSRGMLLASELMGFARPIPHASKIIRPSELIAGMAPSLRDLLGEKHQLKLETRSQTSRVLIDPSQLQLVIHNLVTNSRDAMPDGGTIVISLDVTVESDEEGRPGQYVMISISDTGVGISQENLQKIFDPFYTSKPIGQGTGVGLAVVHQIVSYAGGMIRVESEPGKGSTFMIFLPRVSSL